MKRINPYCVEDVMSRYDISREEAIVKIEKLKKSTTITLENLIAKYGEDDGKKRFDIFRSKSSHTKEKYIEKYGDQWEEHWSLYLQSKSCSLDKFIERYGIEEGKRLFDEYQAKKSFTNSLAGYIDKYGEKEGTDRYEQVTRKRQSASLSHFVEKYGQVDGEIKYKETNAKKDSSSLKAHIKMYGEEEGRKRYENKRMLGSPLFCAIKKEYGEEIASEVYSKYKEKKFEMVVCDYDKVAKHKTQIKRSEKLSKGPVSKESKAFFRKLEISLGRKLQYGRKKDELQLVNLATGRYFCYDCVDDISKTIVEFHGVAWHPKENDTTWTSPFGVDYHTIRQRDLDKKYLAESKGYNYFVVYSDEVKTVDKREEKIKYLSTLILE